MSKGSKSYLQEIFNHPSDHIPEIAGGVIGTVVLAWGVWKIVKIWTDKPETAARPAASGEPAFDFNGRMQNLKLRVIEEKNSDREYLSELTCLEIRRLGVFLSLGQFSKLTEECRRERRAYLAADDMKNYEEAIAKYRVNLNKAFEENASIVLQGLTLQSGRFEESVKYCIEIVPGFGYRYKEILDDAINQNPLKPNAPKIDKQLAIKIYTEANDIARNLKPANLDYFYDIAEALIEDKLFHKKYNIEVEDLERAPCHEDIDVKAKKNAIRTQIEANLSAAFEL